jgi:hypothetical protein
MTLAKLFNGYVNKTINIKAFQTDDVYLPIDTRIFVNYLESTRANYSTSSNMSHDDSERNTITAVDNNQVKKHLK